MVEVGTAQVEAVAIAIAHPRILPKVEDVTGHNHMVQGSIPRHRAPRFDAQTSASVIVAAPQAIAFVLLQSDPVGGIDDGEAFAPVIQRNAQDQVSLVIEQRHWVAALAFLDAPVFQVTGRPPVDVGEIVRPIRDPLVAGGLGNEAVENSPNNPGLSRGECHCGCPFGGMPRLWRGCAAVWSIPR